MFTVYLSVPLITPPVSVVPVIDGQQILLNISINVSMFCMTSEYNIMVYNRISNSFKRNCILGSIMFISKCKIFSQKNYICHMGFAQCLFVIHSLKSHLICGYVVLDASFPLKQT